MTETNHPVAIAGGAIASPLGGFAAGWLFATQECSAIIGCTDTFNPNAALAATFIGWALTGIVATAGGDNKEIAILLFVASFGALLGAVLA